MGFSYTVRGEVADTYQSSPNSGGYYHVSATYWATGKLQTLTPFPGLNLMPSFTYGVDGMGRSTTASASSGQDPVTGVTYNTMNQITGITFGSGDSDTYSYDANSGHMTQFKFNVNGQSLVANIGWNQNGTVSAFSTTDPFNTANNGSCTFGYDDMVRVSSASCAPTGGPAYWSQIFSFDPFGNISKSGSVAFQPTYSSTTNRITSLPGATISYDADGNLLNDGTYTYDWTAFGKASTVNGITITYDALGRAVEQNNAGTYTEIVYDVQGAKAATVNGQALQKGFVRLPAGATAVYQASGLAWYRHSDMLGSSRLATTPTRTVAADRAYAPYGEAYNETGAQDRSFAGHDEDTIGGLYDAPARQYSPVEGRWISPDPAGARVFASKAPQSLNRYAYVSNNPLVFTDPDGLFLCGTACPPRDPCDPDLCIGGGIGGGGENLFEVISDDLGPNGNTGPVGVGGDPNFFLTRALNMLRNTLQTNTKCAGLFKGTDAVGMLDTYVSNNLITFGPSHPQGGDDGQLHDVPFAGSNQGAFTTPGAGSYVDANGNRISASLITINSFGFFWSGTYVTTAGIQSVSSQKGSGFFGLTLDQIQQVVIIHELLHAANIFGPENGDTKQSEANTQAVSDACFK